MRMDVTPNLAPWIMQTILRSLAPSFQGTQLAPGQEISHVLQSSDKSMEIKKNEIGDTVLQWTRIICTFTHIFQQGKSAW